MTDHPDDDRICVVNCSLPATECQCYRSMVQRTLTGALGQSVTFEDDTPRNAQADLEAVAERVREACAKYHDSFLMTETSVDVEKVVASTEAIRALDLTPYTKGTTDGTA